MLASVNQHFHLENTSQTLNLSWEKPGLLSRAVGRREPCTSARCRLLHRPCAERQQPLPRSTGRDFSLLPAWAVCRSLVHSEQPRELGACTGSRGMLGGRNLWARGTGSPLSWGKFPCPNPSWLFLRAQNSSLCREKDMPRSSWIGKHSNNALPGGSCTLVLCTLGLHTISR